MNSKVFFAFLVLLSVSHISFVKAGSPNDWEVVSLSAVTKDLPTVSMSPVKSSLLEEALFDPTYKSQGNEILTTVTDSSSAQQGCSGTSSWWDTAKGVGGTFVKSLSPNYNPNPSSLTTDSFDCLPDATMNPLTGRPSCPSQESKLAQGQGGILDSALKGVATLGVNGFVDRHPNILLSGAVTCGVGAAGAAVATVFPPVFPYVAPTALTAGSIASTVAGWIPGMSGTIKRYAFKGLDAFGF